MPSVAMSGNDVVILDDHIFNDLADGTFAELSFPNKIAKAKVGKNGNSIFSLDETGKLATFKLRVIRGSQDDQFLLGKLNLQLSSFQSTILASGQFIKKIGDGKGNVVNDTYLVSNGIYEVIPGAKGNAEGDSEQSVVEYVIVFANAPRVIR